MSVWIKKYGWIIVVAIIALVVVPASLQWLMTDAFSQTNGGTDDGWLGFWGGYLGAIITVPATVFVAVWSIRAQIKQEHRIDALYKLLATIISFRDDLYIVNAYLKKEEESTENNKEKLRIENVDRLNGLSMKMMNFQKEFDTRSILLGPEDINRREFKPIKEKLDSLFDNLAYSYNPKQVIEDLKKVTDAIESLLDETKKRTEK
ncbi:hypothetical protein A1D15_2724 [Lactiplantibacillus plantarum]|uniref:hypothetical protein n=1 Tax=Lactiplantibacillus plantarum TaxID=1590 RepID=UPI0007B55F74|nr:hypothetical protein [Lactiplantibacillus plantarum]KZU91204.1 hypothetical protein A1D15_2724 [Lactiplantibacillus plantarum]MCJ2383053.1 hypothetical protein [Lactiplantibacillus plantarum]MCK8474654.1 hypothetical protein [Lactiplantibacillus plantarum]QCS78356.1 hypothetical protein FEM46_14075 [Lactiplantibacillus plantarum subsp. plantarum]RDD75565.1 hypothetical protein DVV32_14900 [Lactiplantibacillus plantarum]